MGLFDFNKNSEIDESDLLFSNDLIKDDLNDEDM